MFNNAFNKAAGTIDVHYTDEWPMHVNTGHEYMSQNYMDLGKRYARALIEERCNGAGLFSRKGIRYSELSPMQRGMLAALAGSETSKQYDAALHACQKYGIMNGAAGKIFMSHVAHTRQPQLYIRAPPAVAAPAALAAVAAPAVAAVAAPAVRLAVAPAVALAVAAPAALAAVAAPAVAAGALDVVMAAADDTRDPFATVSAMSSEPLRHVSLVDQKASGQAHVTLNQRRKKARK